MDNYILDLTNHLDQIEIFLNDKEHYIWKILNYDREFFDNNLPKHKRKIVWFHSVDRYPFDRNVFFERS